MVHDHDKGRIHVPRETLSRRTFNRDCRVRVRRSGARLPRYASARFARASRRAGSPGSGLVLTSQDAHLAADADARCGTRHERGGAQPTAIPEQHRATFPRAIANLELELERERPIPSPRLQTQNTKKQNGDRQKAHGELTGIGTGTGNRKQKTESRERNQPRAGPGCPPGRSAPATVTSRQKQSSEAHSRCTG